LINDPFAVEQARVVGRRRLLPDGSEKIIVAAPGEAWELDPDTGKLRWHATMGLAGNVRPSVIVDGDIVNVSGASTSVMTRVASRTLGGKEHTHDGPRTHDGYVGAGRGRVAAVHS
jgi:hypothetical protein